MRYLIVYYTVEPRPPKTFLENEMEALIHEVRDLTKQRAKFVVYEIGKCLGDFS